MLTYIVQVHIKIGVVMMGLLRTALGIVFSVTFTGEMFISGK